MDWDAAIEKNREALKRVLAMLVAMAGPRGQFTFFPRKGALSDGEAVAEKSKLSPAPILPRHLHRAVLALLRPAEAAARRLVIVAARGLTVAAPRQRKPKPMATEPLLRSLGIAVTMAPADLVAAAAAARRAAEHATRPRSLALPLFDRLPRWDGRMRAKARGVPRIWTPGLTEPFPIPRPPAPDDPIDARRLALRLRAIGRALDDLPREAKRFARWRAARDAVGAQIKAELDATGVQLDPTLYVAGAQGRKSRRPFGRNWPLVPAIRRAGAGSPAMRCTKSWTLPTGSPSGRWRSPTRPDRFVERGKIDLQGGVPCGNAGMRPRCVLRCGKEPYPLDSRIR